MWNLISGLKALRENSVQIFLFAIWSLDVLKRIVKIFPKRLLDKEIKKPELKFNPGLGLIGLWTTGPKFRLFLLLRLIGWENSADFLDQSQSEVKLDQSNPRLFSTLNWKLLQRGPSYIILTQSTMRTRSTDRFSLSSLAAIATLLK